MSTAKALILPADVPPRASSVKRQLLFFDSVLLIDPESDAAILNPGEVSETFENGRTVRWGEYCPYSRSSEYVESHRLLFAATHKLQTQGKIRILKAAPASVMDPKFSWIASAAASQDEVLLRSALPDYQPEADPYYLKPNSWYLGMVPSAIGYESKHRWMLESSHRELPELATEWNRLGWVRLGRTIKSLRRAGIESALPVALERVNQNICLALGSKSYKNPPSAPDLANHAISVDVVDPAHLDDKLNDLTWDEVVQLRKAVLPHVAKLRQLLVDAVAIAQVPQNADPQAYLRALRELKEKHKRATNDAREAWSRLSFKTVETAALSTMGGLSTLAPPGGWAHVIQAIALAFVTNMAKGALGDVTKLQAARDNLKASPLLFFDTLPNEVERIVRDRTDGSGADGAANP